MSIMYEYEAIKRRIGKEKYNQIQNFLRNNKHYCLSDIYYNKDAWNEMERWINNNNNKEE